MKEIDPSQPSGTPKAPDNPEGGHKEFDAFKLRFLELTSLFEINKILNSSLELRTILDNVLLTPMGRLMVSKGMVLLADKNNIIRVKNVKGLPNKLLGREFSLEDNPRSSQISADLKDRQEPFFREFREHDMEIVIPMIADGKYLGTLAYGKKFGQMSFTQDEIEFLESLANLAAIAVDKALLFEEVKDTNKKLDKKIQELNTMFEITRELNSTLNESNIAQVLSFAIMGEMLIHKCILLTEHTGSWELAVAKGVSEEVREIDFDACMTDLSGLFAAGRNHVNLNDLELDKEEFGTCKILVAGGVDYLLPMISKERIRGFIGIGKKVSGQEVSNDELEFLETLGNETIIAIENAHLVEEMLEKQRLEDELEIAKDIQKQLLPGTLPKISNIDIVGNNVSSREVGGDYYDCIKLDEGLYGIAIADVSGKSTPAALLMANLQASLHALTLDHQDPVETVSHINNIIFRNTTLDKFITFFYCILDVKKGSIVYTNAGHNPPYLIHSDGSMETLETGGLILGIMADAPYESEEKALKPGDVLFMFTDGITEAMDEKEEEFGEERLEPLLKSLYSLPLAEIVETVEKNINDYAGTMPQADDMTILALKMT